MNIEITEDRSRYKTTDFTWNVRIDGVLIAVAKTPGAGDYVALEVMARNDAAKLKQALSALEAVDAAITAELAHMYDDSPPQTQSEIMAGVVQSIWDDHDAMLMPEGDYLDANGMRVAAPVDEPISGGAVLRHSGLPNPLARIQAAERDAMLMPEGDYIDADGMRVPAPVHCQQPDDLCDVHNPCPAHAADAAAYLAAEVDPQYSDAARFAEDPCCPCGMPALFFVQYPGKTYAYCPECYRDLNAGRPPLLAQCAAIIRRCLGSTTGAGSIIDELRRVDRALNAEGW